MSVPGAVTFDFWDCIVRDDSDEPRRAAAGLPTKRVARRALFGEELAAHHPQLDATRIDAAWRHLSEWFRREWHENHRTPPIGDRLARGLRFLALSPTPGWDAMVAEIADMEVEIPPELAPGIAEALSGLSARGYRIGIISDAIVTPGVGLRTILERYGLLRYFHHNVFSDEWGAAKPAARVFERACAGLEVPAERLVHIGDRESRDVAGAVEFGARAVLYVGCVDRGTVETTRAQAVCRHHSELPEIADRLLSPRAP